MYEYTLVVAMILVGSLAAPQKLFERRAATKSDNHPQACKGKCNDQRHTTYRCGCACPPRRFQRAYPTSATSGRITLGIGAVQHGMDIFGGADTPSALAM